MTKKLRLAVPKGRILQDLLPIFARAKIFPESDFFDENSRKLIFTTNHSNLEIVRVRSFDVAVFVKFGVADLGICGSDVFEEFSSKEMFALLDLEIGKCRLCLASPSDFAADFSQMNYLKIATKYPNITNRYFEKFGIQTEIIKLNGAIEIAPKLGLCNFIIDLVSSGKTLFENNMKEVVKIFDVSSLLIANRTSFKIHRPTILKLIAAIDEGK